MLLYLKRENKMVLQASGQIDFGQIQTEFGGSNPIGLDEYYRSGSYVNAQLTYSSAGGYYWTNNNQVIRYTSSNTYTFIWEGTVVCQATGSNFSSGLDHISGTASGHTIYVYGCGTRRQNYSSYQRWVIWRKNKAAYSGIPYDTSSQIAMSNFYNASNSA